jgi:hypothetical protein
LRPEISEALPDRVRRLGVRGGSENFGGLGDVPALQAAFLDDAAGGDDFFVKAVAVARNHRKAGVGEHCGGAQRGAGDRADGDTVDLLPVGRCPDLGAEKPETALDKAMVEVGQHDVVAAGGYLGIEGDGALQAGVGMDEAGEARLPGGVGEAWHVEGVWDASERGGDQARLVSKVERDVDHGLDVGGREVEITPGFVELVGVAAGELADVLLGAGA